MAHLWLLILLNCVQLSCMESLIGCSDLNIAFPENGQTIVMEEASIETQVFVEIDIPLNFSCVGCILELSLQKELELDILESKTYRIKLWEDMENEKNVSIGNFSAGVYKLSLNALSAESRLMCVASQYFSIFKSSFEDFLFSMHFPCPLDLRARHISESTIDFLTRREERWQDKRRCLERYVELYPNNLATRFFLGKVYESCGLWNLAQKSFQAVTDSARNSKPTIAQSGAAQTAATHLFEYMSDDFAIARHLASKESSQPPPNCTWTVHQRHSRPSNSAEIDVGGDGELYLSVIMTFRHDDSVYCRIPRDACVDRLRAALTLLLHLLAKHALPAEVILVEWSPCRLRTDSDRPCRPRRGGYLSAADAVRRLVPAPAGRVAIRVLEVSPALHARTYNPYDYDHLEHHGKNAGARRARGRFLAFTNPDDLWTEALVERLARRDLRPDAVYSAERGDVAADPPPHARPEGLLRYFERYSVRPLPAALAAASQATQAAGSVSPQRLGGGAAGGPGEPARYRFAACLAGEDEDPEAAAGAVPGRAVQMQAPGDFMLAAWEAVEAARGLPEVPTNTYVDSMGLCVLLAHGLGQLVLPQPCGVYHQAHPHNDATKLEVLTGAEFRQVLEAILAAGPLANRRPALHADGEPLEWEEHVPWERWNTHDWGLAGEALPETRLTPSCGP